MNLAAELEIRLTGRSPTRGLRPGLAELIPQARNYLLLIIDGLGDRPTHPSQPQPPSAGIVEPPCTAPFPTTTTVGLSSVATALAPMQHGVIGYTQWMPALRTVVNMLMWVDMAAGQPIDCDPAGFHPSPNLAERLNVAGARTVIFQPTELLDTPLSNMVCRGAERHGYSSPFDIRPSALFNAGNRTLAVVYLSAVDAAAHASGQRSQAYSTALSQNRSGIGTPQTFPATRHHPHRISRPRPLRHPTRREDPPGREPHRRHAMVGRRPRPHVLRTPRTGTPDRPPDQCSVRQRRATTPMAGRRTPTPNPQRVPGRGAPSSTGNGHPSPTPPQLQHRPPRRDHTPRATDPPTRRLDSQHRGHQDRNAP